MIKGIGLILLGLIVMLTGIFLATHWGTFYGSVIAAIGGLIIGGSASTLAIKKLGS